MANLNLILWLAVLLLVAAACAFPGPNVATSTPSPWGALLDGPNVCAVPASLADNRTAIDADLAAIIASVGRDRKKRQEAKIDEQTKGPLALASFFPPCQPFYCCKPALIY